MLVHRIVLVVAAVGLYSRVAAVDRLPGASELAMPAIVQLATPPEAVEMWKRSATNPSALFDYLDRNAQRPLLAAKRYDAESVENRLLNLEYMAIERLGDIATPALIPRIERYASDKRVAKEYDAATTARLAAERIRFRARGRDAYVDEMIAWVLTGDPAPGTAEQQVKDVWRKVIDGARALGVIKARETVPVLIAKQQSPGWNNTHLGLYLIRSLARIGDPRALDVMREQLLGYAWYVQAAKVPLEPEEPDVAWSYWQSRTVGMTQQQAIQELIRSLADDPAPLQAVRVLELIGEPAVPSLIVTLAGPTVGKDAGAARRLAAVALGNLRSREAVGPLQLALRDKSDVMRGIAAHALGQIGDRSSVPNLVLTLNDPVRAVQISAMRALGMIADPSAQGDVLRVMRASTYANVRFAAVETLGKIGTRKTVPELEAVMAKEPDQNVLAAMRIAATKLKSK
jgi:HEAT repeat protein